MNNNYGADVNFSIIKDIIDREVKIKDEEINNSITTPLYLGLAATMIGIIFGLFAMPNLNNENNTHYDKINTEVGSFRNEEVNQSISDPYIIKEASEDYKFSEGINALINGVKIAMLGSLIGLVCTTVLSSFFYKNAKREVEADKNKQLSYLQGHLLPELIKAEETGVAGLKESINSLARSLINLNNAAKLTSNSIETQDNILKRIETLGVANISRVNLQLFERMENSLSKFDHFANYLNQMGIISKQLERFADKTKDIDKVLTSIDISIDDNKRILEFFTSHMDEVERRGTGTLEFLDEADRRFAQATEIFSENIKGSYEVLTSKIDQYNNNLDRVIDTLIDELMARIENINKISGIHEETLSSVYQAIGENLNNITSEYTRKLSDAVPNINYADNTIIMDKINTTLSKIYSEIKADRLSFKKRIENLFNKIGKKN